MPPKQTDFSPGNDLEQQLIDLLTRISAEGRSTESQVEQINLLTTMTTPTHHASLQTVYETDEPPQQEEADADSTPTPLPLTNSDALQETADALQDDLDVRPQQNTDPPRPEESDADPLRLLPPHATLIPTPTATDHPLQQITFYSPPPHPKRQLDIQLPQPSSASSLPEPSNTPPEHAPQPHTPPVKQPSPLMALSRKLQSSTETPQHVTGKATAFTEEEKRKPSKADRSPSQP